MAHNLFRTGIAVGGVALGVSFMVMMSAMMQGFEVKFIQETVESNAHITIYDEAREDPDAFASWIGDRLGGAASVASSRPRQRVARIKKPLEILDAVRRRPDVLAAAPNVVGTCVLGFGTRTVGASLEGIDPDRHEAVVATEQYMQQGRLADLRASGGAVLLGSGLAEKLGVRRGDTVMASVGPGAARALRVMGIVHTGITTVDYVRVLTTVSVAQQLLGLGRDVNRILIRLSDHARAEEVAAAIERMIGYRTESWQEANRNFLEIFVIQHIITYVVTGGIMIVSAFGILNILVMQVLEKYPEIAMLKSVGYTARDIATLFLMEGIAIGIMGIVAGSVAGWHLTEFLGSLKVPMKGIIEAEGFLVSNEPFLYGIAGGTAMACTLVASVLPALRAGRLDPVAILRGRP